MSSSYGADELKLSRIREGDEQLLRELFDAYWPRFQQYAKKSYGLAGEDVKDIYARAFTSFYVNIREGKLLAPLQSKLSTYLFGIARNYIRKHFEKKRKEFPAEFDNPEMSQKLSYQPVILDFYQLQWQKSTINKLLMKITETCRQLLLLTFVEEYSDEAIKIEMGLASEGAVRQRRFTCLERLRKLVKGAPEK